MKNDRQLPSELSEELVSPCGMNCGRCSGYLALQHDVKNKGIRMPYCIGCRPRDKQCAFLKKRCKRLLQKKVDFCFECPEYPCRNLQHIDERYRTFFHLSPLENLNFIKTHGVKKFLQRDYTQWKCSTCNEMICCHNGLCFQCKLDLLKVKKKLYRWDEKFE
jgi:hypothetical protein